MRLSRTISVELLSRFGRAIVSLAVISLFISALGADTFGRFVLFEAVVTVAGIGVDLGIGSAVQKRVSERSLPEVVSTAASVKAALLVVVGVVVVLAAPFLERYLAPSLTVYLVAAVGAQQFGRLGLHALRGDLRVADAALVQLAGDIALLVVGYALAATGVGLLALVYAFLTQWTLIAVVSLGRVRYVPTLPSVAAARSLFDFSKYTFVSAVVAGALYGWLDTLVIGYFLPPGAVAVYEAAWRVARGVSLVSQSIGTAMFPQVSDWHAADRLPAVAEAVRDATTGALVVVFPAVVGAWLFGSRLLSSFLGPETAVGAAVLVVLLVGKLPEAVNDVVARTLFGLDRPVYTAYAAVLFVALNVGLNVLLVPRYGIEGAAVATSLAFAVNATVNVAFLRSELPVSFDLRTIGYCVVASLCMGGALWVTDSVARIDSVASLSAVVGGGGLLYFLVLLAPPSVRRKATTLAHQLVR